ncbi:boron transporter 4-like [Tripterygium wilfordii]|uniref:Boron transporter 4-like n=1 Tax=Tripterygium wilfordii TaxID=458696 RepID=A0A7J7BX14_TRIWF|nr:boron transporter 4-like [Tripterygium wilfordii]
MESLGTPFKGIIGDIKGRAACYKEDWTSALCSGIRLLAPTAYIFFASALPVIAFGEQLYRNTGTFSLLQYLKDPSLKRWKLV